MIPYDLIRKKQHGQRHSDDEITYLVQGYTDGSIPDYQMAAWLMAVYFRGLDVSETSAMVTAMLHTGKQLDLSDIAGPKIDKHSTGGVGDKVSLILAPLVASLGVKVPMISGRGLGHTGGTLDKLEAIPGFTTDLSVERFRQILHETGAFIMSQTSVLVPADKKMYAIRNVTATVRSIPLIVSSIMSKKIAEDIDGLVLDVKCGSGAFMNEMEQARELSRALVDTGLEHGLKCEAIITNMDQPLGRAVGNLNEVREAVQCLQGDGPDDVMKVTKALAVQMLLMAETTDTADQAEDLLNTAIADGSAYNKFREFAEAQGGDPDKIERDSAVPSCTYHNTIHAPEDGFIAEIDSYRIGMTGVELGAGRKKLGDEIDPHAGIEILKKTGEQVKKGDVLLEYYTNNNNTEKIENDLLQAYKITGQRITPPPVVYTS